MPDISVNWTAIEKHRDVIGSQGIDLYMKLVSLAPAEKPRTVKITIKRLGELMGWSQRKVRYYAVKLKDARLLEIYAETDEYGRPVPSSYQLLA